ncbi:MAG: hypothetical protein U0M21_00410 [Emergencia sp.]|nr:hypothetical protein [Emergencia sp.]
MIFNSREYVERDLELQRHMLKNYRAALQGLPIGKLYVKEYNGRRYYTKWDVFRGKKRTKYLGNGSEMEVQLLQKRYFLETSIEAMMKNIELMEEFLSQYMEIDPNYMQKTLPKAYQSLPLNCFDAAGAIDIRRWGEKKYRASEKHAENLKHITAAGEKVRSKSEVIIANGLMARGIPYRYEEEISLNGYKVIPDFKIIDERKNRIVIWEHFGLIGDTQYLKNCIYKLQNYIQSGFVPGVNLIITFDDADGNIDGLMIERTIQLWFGNTA